MSSGVFYVKYISPKGAIFYFIALDTVMLAAQTWISYHPGPRQLEHLYIKDLCMYKCGIYMGMHYREHIVITTSNICDYIWPVPQDNVCTLTIFTCSVHSIANTTSLERPHVRRNQCQSPVSVSLIVSWLENIHQSYVRWDHSQLVHVHSEDSFRRIQSKMGNQINDHQWVDLVMTWLP